MLQFNKQKKRVPETTYIPVPFTNLERIRFPVSKRRQILNSPLGNTRRCINRFIHPRRAQRHRDFMEAIKKSVKKLAVLSQIVSLEFLNTSYKTHTQLLCVCVILIKLWLWGLWFIGCKNIGLSFTSLVIKVFVLVAFTALQALFLVVCLTRVLLYTNFLNVVFFKWVQYKSNRIKSNLNLDC